MLRRFAKIANELIEVEQTADTDLLMNGSLRFDWNVSNYHKMLQEIDCIKKSMHTEGQQISKDREDHDFIFDEGSI